MNILIDELPTSVMVDGVCRNINYGFRAMILIEICIFDGRLSKEQRTMNALNLFYLNNIPQNRGEAIKAMLSFYRCGQTGEHRKAEKGKKPSARAGIRSYSFEQDAGYIFSAFLTQYGIDLNKMRSNDLHWWKFKAMFVGLNEDLRISKIMAYRVMDLSGMKGKQLAFYKKKKELYALHDEINADSKLALAERDERMKAYVRKRFEERGK